MGDGNEGLPKEGLLDLFSSNAKLLRELILETRALNAKIGVGVAPAVPGGAPGGLITIPSIGTMSLEELRRRLESGEWEPYKTHTVSDMSTAAADSEISIEGDYLACWTNGSYAGIGVRFNHPNNSIIYFSQFNPIRLMPFWKLYLTYTAQANKSLCLFIGRQGSAEGLVSPISGLILPFYILHSDKDTHFTGAIAQDASEEENLTGLMANRIRITGIAIQSDQQLHYQVALYGNDAFGDANLDLDYFKHIIDLDLTTYGIQTGGVNQYRMAMDGLAIDYEDLDGTEELHVALVNRSATAKNAGATGEVKLSFTYEEKAGGSSIAGGGEGGYV